MPSRLGCTAPCKDSIKCLCRQSTGTSHSQPSSQGSSYERPIYRSASFNPADEGIQLPDITAARNDEGEVMARQATVRRTGNESRSASLPSNFVPTGSHWRGVRYPEGQEPPGPTPEEQGLVCPPPDPFATNTQHAAQQEEHEQEQQGGEEKPGFIGRLKARVKAGAAKVGSSKKSDGVADPDEAALTDERTGFERLPASQRPWDKSVKSARPYEGV